MKNKKLTTKIKSEVPIIDVEISNDLSPKWDYREGDIITLGILKGNEITIIQREKGDNLEEFKIVLRDILKNIKELHAFNFKFEQGTLYGFLGASYKIKEIKPFLGKGWSKERFFNELLNIVEIENETNDSFIDGSLVQQKYSEEKYDEIINHNTNCLIKEAYILKYKKDILEKFKDNINSDGWYQENKERKTFDKTNWDKERATKYQISFLLKNDCDYINDNLHELNKLQASNKIEGIKKVQNNLHKK